MAGVTRASAVPPQLTGFSPVRLIGVGGYADVFLYRQLMPQRDVAVKVLVADRMSGTQQRRQFTAEANLMARVSSHPYIVSVFEAAISPDGRPYLVMEFYPGANFLERARRERLSVPDALRVGIQIASAVETAHRVGILHRDIKPANILTSEYGRPGLTDFGIAAPGEPGGEEADGMSVPWAPPEAFGTGRLDERADIYSLAATVYHLLAGRSPFEVASGQNSPLDLMNRIERQQVPVTGRPDTPASLERLLAVAMSKDPQHRPASAREFARLLQSIESELHLAVTQLELADDGRNVRLLDDTASDDATRIKGVTTVHAQTDPVAIDSVPVAPTGNPVPQQRRREGILAEPEVESTVVRSGETTPTSNPPTSSPSRRGGLVAGIALGAVAVAVAAAVLFSGSSDDRQGTPAVTEVPNDGGGVFEVSSGPGAVEDLVVTTAGDGKPFLFSWAAPAGAGQDVQYQVTESDESGSEVVNHPPQSETSFGADLPCVEVVAIEAGAASVPVRTCGAAP